jgi:hypothetical protein
MEQNPALQRARRARRARPFLPAIGAVLLLAGCVTPLPPGERTMFDGTYSGVAQPTDPNLPDCGDPMPVRDFVVRDGDVRFGTIGGPIAADGTFRADNRGVEMAGRFVPGAFEGQLLWRPVCVRTMRLIRQ